MSYALQLLCLASGLPSDFDGEYVTEFDPDFRDGLGRVDSTKDINKAKAFPDATAAFSFWKTQSKVRPTREDGRPNRPLTAFTVTTVKIS